MTFGSLTEIRTAILLAELRYVYTFCQTKVYPLDESEKYLVSVLCLLSVWSICDTLNLETGYNLKVNHKLPWLNSKIRTDWAFNLTWIGIDIYILSKIRRVPYHDSKLTAWINPSCCYLVSINGYSLREVIDTWIWEQEYLLNNMICQPKFE